MRSDPAHNPELYIYSRYRNPTVVAAEEEIMKLEGTAWALLTQSGMSAIDTALSIFQKGENNFSMALFQRDIRRNNFICRISLKEQKRS